MEYVNMTLTIDEAVVVDKILAEVRRASEKHPDFVASLSDGALVISEESGEVADAVLKYFYEGGDFKDIAKEATHVAATAIRLINYIANNPVPSRIKND